MTGDGLLLIAIQFQPANREQYRGAADSKSDGVFKGGRNAHIGPRVKFALELVETQARSIECTSSAPIAAQAQVSERQPEQTENDPGGNACEQEPGQRERRKLSCRSQQDG